MCRTVQLVIKATTGLLVSENLKS